MIKHEDDIKDLMSFLIPLGIIGTFLSLLFVVGVVLTAKTAVLVIGLISIILWGIFFFLMQSRPTGNSAFDAYVIDSIEKLKDEKMDFNKFKQDQSEAEAKAIFDKFMKGKK